MGRCLGWFKKQSFLRTIRYPIVSWSDLTVWKVDPNAALSFRFPLVWPTMRLYILYILVSYTYPFLKFYGWTHWCSYFQDRLSLCHFWDAGRHCPSWWLASPGREISPVSWSWSLSDIYCYTSLPDTVPVSSWSWQTFPRLSVWYQIHSLLGHYNNPWSWYPLQDIDRGYWCMSSWHYTLLAWMPVPWFLQLVPLTHSLQAIVIFYFKPSLQLFYAPIFNSQVVYYNICTAF